MCECGSTSFVKNGKYTICSECGLVIDETPEMDNPKTWESKDFPRRKITSSIVYNERDYGSNIYLEIDSKFRNNSKIKRLAKMHKLHVKTHRNVVDIKNLKILEELIETLQIDDRTANRCRDALAEAVQSNKDLAMLSRRTYNSHNYVFLSSLVSIIDQRVNLKESYSKKIAEWAIDKTLQNINIDASINKITNDFLKIVKDEEMNLAGYVKIIDRLAAIDRDRVSWINQTKKNVMHRFNAFRRYIDSEINFLKNDEKLVKSIISRNADQFNGKIFKLVSMVNAPGLILDYLVHACIAVVYAYYDKPVKFSIENSRIRKYLAYIHNRCGFEMRRGSESPLAFIIRPRLVVESRNMFYDAVFNDEYDQILEDTMSFCDEIDREDLSVIYSIINEGIYDLRYIEHKIKSTGRDGTLEIFTRAPFLTVKDNMVSYSRFINDIKKEIKNFMTRENASTHRVEENIIVFIGTRRANRNNRDMYSINVLIKKRNGTGEYVHSFPVGECKEVIEHLYSISRTIDEPITPRHVMRVLLDQDYIWRTTGRKVKPSHKYKVYMTFKILFESGYLEREQLGFVTSASLSDSINFIDSIEVKH